MQDRAWAAFAWQPKLAWSSFLQLLWSCELIYFDIPCVSTERSEICVYFSYMNKSVWELLVHVTKNCTQKTMRNKSYTIKYKWNTSEISFERRQSSDATFFDRNYYTSVILYYGLKLNFLTLFPFPSISCSRLTCLCMWEFHFVTYS